MLPAQRVWMLPAHNFVPCSLGGTWLSPSFHGEQALLSPSVSNNNLQIASKCVQYFSCSLCRDMQIPCSYKHSTAEKKPAAEKKFRTTANSLVFCRKPVKNVRPSSFIKLVQAIYISLHRFFKKPTDFLTLLQHKLFWGGSFSVCSHFSFILEIKKFASV
jgi:hypothetical protein